MNQWEGKIIHSNFITIKEFEDRKGAIASRVAFGVEFERKRERETLIRQFFRNLYVTNGFSF
jgi:hypothetical protein